MAENTEIIKYEEEVFKFVIKPMAIWIGITSIITLFFYLITGASKSDNPNFSLNPNIGINQNIIGFVAIGILIGLAVVALTCKITNENIFKSIVILTCILMGVIIILTGGILDSPFSGAFALFNVSFITLQQTKEYKYFNFFLIVISIILIIFPYYVFGQDNMSTNQLNGKVYLVNWQQNWYVTGWRITISIFMLIATGLTSKYIGDKINKLWDGVKNKTNNE